MKQQASITIISSITITMKLILPSVPTILV